MTMTQERFDGFSDLDDFDQIETAKDTREKFPCLSCGGTGRYRGARVHQQSSTCFACNGRGFFLTSPRHRAKAKQSYQSNKIKKRADTWQKHAKLMEWLAKAQDWNEFAASLVDQVNRGRGALSDKQLAAATRMMEKTLATKKKRAAEQAKLDKAAPVLDLVKIHELFETAQESGLKKPRIRIGELQISLAPATGKNAGHLYVKDDGEYAGKIAPEGKFYALRDARKDIMGELQEFAADPLAVAKAHGRRTGSCSCCGRELTNGESIELGIGPICAENWGI